MLTRSTNPHDMADELAISAAKRDDAVSKAHAKHNAKRNDVLDRAASRKTVVESLQKELDAERVALDNLIRNA